MTKGFTCCNGDGDDVVEEGKDEVEADPVHRPVGQVDGRGHVQQVILKTKKGRKKPRISKKRPRVSGLDRKTIGGTYQHSHNVSHEGLRLFPSRVPNSQKVSAGAER